MFSLIKCELAATGYANKDCLSVYRMRTAITNVAKYISYGLANPTPEEVNPKTIDPTQNAIIFASQIFDELAKSMSGIASVNGLVKWYMPCDATQMR